MIRVGAQVAWVDLDSHVWAIDLAAASPEPTRLDGGGVILWRALPVESLEQLAEAVGAPDAGAVAQVGRFIESLQKQGLCEVD